MERQLEFKPAPAAERCFLHCLAADFGLMSESFGEDKERAVTVLKKTRVEPLVPARTLSDVVQPSIYGDAS